MTASIHFPSWLYHATHPPRIFETEAEIEAAAAEGWVDSPGKAAESPSALKARKRQKPIEKI